MRDFHGLMCFGCGVMAMVAWNQLALVGADRYFWLYALVTVALNFFAHGLRNSASGDNQ